MLLALGMIILLPFLQRLTQTALWEDYVEQSELTLSCMLSLPVHHHYLRDRLYVDNST